MSRRGSDWRRGRTPEGQRFSLPLACHDRVGLARTGSFRTFKDSWSGRNLAPPMVSQVVWSSEGLFPDNVPLIVFAVVSRTASFSLKSASHGSPPPVRVTAWRIAFGVMAMRVNVNSSPSPSPKEVI